MNNKNNNSSNEQEWENWKTKMALFTKIQERERSTALQEDYHKQQNSITKMKIEKETENKAKIICSVMILLVEIIYATIILNIDMKKIIFSDEAFGYIAVNTSLFINAFIVGIIERIGKIKFGTIIVSVLNGFLSIWIFVASLEGLIEFFFFGIIGWIVWSLSSMLVVYISGES